jgi:glycosyltransferase involved in cell wall biosynthesis
VSDEIVNLSREASDSRKNWVVFSGTHEWSQGLEQLINAWCKSGFPGWELHIAGVGPLTPKLKQLAEGNRSIRFHGLLNRNENARLLCTAKIGVNPQDVTKTPGNVFAFKIIEYLAACLHVITTPRGALEPELEAGVTYIPDNAPETILACLKRTIQNNEYERKAEKAALATYGPDAVSRSLNTLLAQVTRKK